MRMRKRKTCATRLPLRLGILFLLPSSCTPPTVRRPLLLPRDRPFPLHILVAPLVAPQSLRPRAHLSPTTHRPTSQVNTTCQSMSPTSCTGKVDRKSGPRLCWEEGILLCIKSIRDFNLWYVPLFVFSSLSIPPFPFYLGPLPPYFAEPPSPSSTVRLPSRT
jgi:hypothetical protein